MKRPFSAMTLAMAMELIPADRLLRWDIPTVPRPLSETVRDYLLRLRVFDLENTEAAKRLLIDALLADVVPNFPPLKIWKAMPLETHTLTGVADYLLSPDYAYLKRPLLCVAEAKRDDFVQGRAQCIAEMAACRWNNHQDGYEIETFGIVSNGHVWQFYRLAAENALFESALYTINDLPPLLGALDHICAECAKNVP